VPTLETISGAEKDWSMTPAAGAALDNRLGFSISVAISLTRGGHDLKKTNMNRT